MLRKSSFLKLKESIVVSILISYLPAIPTPYILKVEITTAAAEHLDSIWNLEGEWVKNEFYDNIT